MFEAGLLELREELAAAASNYLQRLASAGNRHPEWEILDSPEWAKIRMREILAREFSPKSANRPSPSLNAPGAERNEIENEPWIAIWFKWVCDGAPDFDRFEETGRPTHWCAPSFLLWRRSRVSNERLAPELTRKIIRSAQRLLESRLEVELERAQHKARFALASGFPAYAFFKPFVSKPDSSTIYAKRRAQSLLAQQKIPPPYRSPLKRGIQLALIRNPHGTDLELCAWLDEDAPVDLPKNLNSNGSRSFVDAYKRKASKNLLASAISKVRRDMRRSGLLH
jgi:hypothetical protein